MINEATTYAPQMPWYMSHYCDAQFKPNPGTNVYPDSKDPVCYADYFSDMNDALNNFRDVTTWPNSAPWSVWPSAPAPPAPNNHCPSVQTSCTLVMGGFDLSPVCRTRQGSIKNTTDFCSRGSITHWQAFPKTIPRMIFYVIFPGMVPGITCKLRKLPGDQPISPQPICSTRPYSTPSWELSRLSRRSQQIRRAATSLSSDLSHPASTPRHVLIPGPRGATITFTRDSAISPIWP